MNNPDEDELVNYISVYHQCQLSVISSYNINVSLLHNESR